MLIFILSVLTIIYFILGILISFHFKYLVDFSINYDISSNLYIISYFILALYILKNINSIEINIISLKLINKLDFILNNKIFKQLLLLPFSYYKKEVQPKKEVTEEKPAFKRNVYRTKRAYNNNNINNENKEEEKKEIVKENKETEIPRRYHRRYRENKSSTNA